MIKKEAWEWISNLDIPKKQDLKIMERFPIVTYYSWSLNRYITPYTDNIQDIYEYATHNNIDLLVVDTLDFEEYRPELTEYLKETPDWFTKIQEFVNNEWQKVILYEVKN